MMDPHMPRNRITREAWDAQVGKQVDLVIYKSGERIVIGRAEIEPDGKIKAQIAKDVRKELWTSLWPRLGDISINPKLGD